MSTSETVEKVGVAATALVVVGFFLTPLEPLVRTAFVAIGGTVIVGLLGLHSVRFAYRFVTEEPSEQ